MTSAAAAPAGRPPLELVLQNLKIGGSVSGRHDDLAIDDRGTCLDVQGVVRDLLETAAPVVAAAGKCPHRFVNEAELERPVALQKSPLPCKKPALLRDTTTPSFRKQIWILFSKGEVSSR
jgi:hypothetical protein